MDTAVNFQGIIDGFVRAVQINEFCPVQHCLDWSDADLDLHNFRNQ